MAKTDLAKAFKEMRQQVAAEQSPFGKATAEQKKKRKQKALADMETFAKTYLPHHCKKPFSEMHRDMFKKYQGFLGKAENDEKGSKDVNAAPRGNAKSTITTLILPLFAIFAGKQKFIVILSDTADQAHEFLEMIKTEIEINERLKEDFPKIFGPGSKWMVGHIITRNGVKLKSFGSAKRIRGARHGSYRPTLVICDDLEGDESVESPDQRKKLESWFFKAVMKLGADYTIYIVVGTVLHYDSLLAKLLNKPGWSNKKYKAVIEWAENSMLWQAWEMIFNNPANDHAEQEADEFFKKHEKKMLAGTKVLWPEGEPYYYLMKMRISDGPAFFDSEKQNEPINPDDCTFQESWFIYWDDENEYSKQRYEDFYCTIDPSMGKRKSKKSDPAAILVGGVQKNGLIDVIEAEIVKLHPDAIMERIFDLHLQYNFSKIGIEEIQFQELFKDNVLKEGTRRRIYPPVEGVRPNIDKTLRINKLQPHIKNGLIRFRRNQTTLIEQLKYFPKAAHDDGPDALEMLFSLINQGAGGPRIRRIA